MDTYNGISVNNQDQMACQFRVYIEGIEVPFISGNVDEAYERPPTASITLPWVTGLETLGRNYQPKIHIFWVDHNFAVPRELAALEREKDEASCKLIFEGNIIGSSISKTYSTSGGSEEITLSCEHKSTVMNSILMRFASQMIEGYVEGSSNTGSSPGADGASYTSMWNNQIAIQQALQGITEGGSGPTGCPTELYSRLQGTPGFMYVLWNLFTQDATKSGLRSQAVSDMFEPYVEDTIRLWKRMTGHKVIEDGIQAYQEDFDGNGTPEGSTVSKIRVPGAFRTFMGDAARTVATTGAMQARLNAMSGPQVVSYGEISTQMLDMMEYQMLTLAAPQKAADGRTDYVVCPKLDQYYAPICNAILPNMIESVHVSCNYADIPTRQVTLLNTSQLVGSYTGTSILTLTAPVSVSEARAPGQNLLASISSVNSNVGLHEWGQGIRAITDQGSMMYSMIASYMKQNAPNATYTNKDPLWNQAAKAWNNAFPGQEAFNPVSPESQIDNWMRVNMMRCYMRYSMRAAQARTLQVSGCFNPYSIVGYPMDIVDAVPSRSSYHGTCTSITHTFFAMGQASTSYGLSQVQTFDELATHQMPNINPYLTVALNFLDDFRIYRNATAYGTACKVYGQVYGIGAAEPGLLQDVRTGCMSKFNRVGGVWVTEDLQPETGVRGAPMLQDTVRGSLMLIARNLMSLADVQSDDAISFIHLDDWAAEVMNSNAELTLEESVVKKRLDQEGKPTTIPMDASPYLTYANHTPGANENKSTDSAPADANGNQKKRYGPIRSGYQAPTPAPTPAPEPESAATRNAIAHFKPYTVYNNGKPIKRVTSYGD